jgi:fumarylpyruvate hydrolase
LPFSDGLKKKSFFFEKKKQKTFAPGGSSAAGANNASRNCFQCRFQSALGLAIWKSNLIGADMSQFVFEPPAVVTVPVAGEKAFPVRRVFCVGRNYAAHAREMGGDPNREPPFFFTKPADALVTNGADAPYPTVTENLHHEMELIVAIGRGGADISPEEALHHVFGYAAGLDLTRRDLQDEAKAARRPWDMSKGFDASAPIGEIAPAEIVGHPSTGRIALSVNGQVRQLGDLADQIWAVPDVIAYLSKLVALAPGDLIFTGTPDGVGTLSRGDAAEGEIEGVGRVTVRIV